MRIWKFRRQISTGDGRSRRGRLCSCDEEEARGTLRAMCEASRGRQLRLIRAETDSGRSDGLLNTLTCRQPSARLHFLHPSPFASFATWPNFVVRRARARRPARRRNRVTKLSPLVMFALKFANLILNISSTAMIPDPELAIQKNGFWITILCPNLYQCGLTLSRFNLLLPFSSSRN